MPEIASGGRERSRSTAVAAIVAAVFGLMTIASGGRVLFGPADVQRAAGEVVPFILWFNFVSGFAYVAAGIGLWRMQRWGFTVAAALALAIAVALAGFGVHVAGGGGYELRTLYALVLRLAVWAAIAVAACRVFACPLFSVWRRGCAAGGKSPT